MSTRDLQNMKHPKSNIRKSTKDLVEKTVNGEERQESVSGAEVSQHHASENTAQITSRDRQAL